MTKKELKKEMATEVACVRKEMAKPRMAQSARVAERNLDVARIPNRASTSLPGPGDKIIPSSLRVQSDQAQTLVDAHPGHQDLRIETVFREGQRDDGKLKKKALASRLQQPKNATRRTTNQND